MMNVLGKPANHQERLEKRLSALRLALRELRGMIDEKKLELVPLILQHRDLRVAERELTVQVLANNPAYRSALQRAPGRSHGSAGPTVRVARRLTPDERRARALRGLDTRRHNAVMGARIVARQAELDGEGTG